MIQLDFLIDPVAKGRPRFARGRAYTPKKTHDFERQVKSMAREQYRNGPMAGPLKVVVEIYIKRPKSVSEKKRPYPVVKPDVDNLVKSVLDPLNGVIYVDDSQIIELSVVKLYSQIGSIGVKIMSYP
jgi:Holliday junction resolvase RusA-like endonuclease